jgi:hypothetical protein
MLFIYKEKNQKKNQNILYLYNSENILRLKKIKRVF